MKKKKLFSVLSAEGKSSIFNPGFAAGVLLLTIVFVTAGYSYMEYLQEMGGSVEGAPWIVLFTYCISSDQSLLLLPLFVPLAASGNAQTELKSRFCLFLAERSGKKEYLLGKASGAAISGGLMTVFSYILTLCIVSIACMNITDVRVRKVAKEGKMKAVVSITLDEEFVVHDIKVIEGEKAVSYTHLTLPTT